MHSVVCKIRSRTSERWIEVEIGVDDSGQNFWRLIAKSSVAFAQFNATVGRWDPTIFFGKEPFSGVPSIVLFSADPDPFVGFVLFRPGDDFYRLGCGRTISDGGSREATDDVSYRMDFLCA